jgi:hypothetical protein
MGWYFVVAASFLLHDREMKPSFLLWVGLAGRADPRGRVLLVTCVTAIHGSLVFLRECCVECHQYESQNMIDLFKAC